MNIGIIGAGAIATYLLNELNENKTNIQITSLYVRDHEKYKRLEEEYNIRLYTNLEQFLKADIDIVVEAANIEAVKQLLPEIITQKDAVVISIGALAEEEFLHEIKCALEKNQRHIYLPSGAIGGLDLVQNVSAVGKIKNVLLETRKPANTLVNAPIDEEQIIFEGTARKAIEKFPKNINVSIALALAGVGFDDTKVKIIADPHTENNLHTISVNGEFGQATFSITNKPLPSNPNTSYLAAISIIGTLKRLTSSIKIGM
ncbi:aspartate dehydrogenase [Pseudogracilibacillus auburnensis]|uniref:L-aspartate dehydrogenase n=1 Tax=Pseudogracilibacillus auburnensis TaxID=1494959 RepID=A0A2V3W9W9_9BACI|nr:aspartate dehydrogenase [Pseudogracilibacillus auburnensis]MBO1003654.1 aspartate dehydrogenase [Pseudogracilibacillus auburnensis]PXW90336.1 aspartate dehydrogenase [Pseudogracilibacillus auburnensis]